MLEQEQFTKIIGFIYLFLEHSELAVFTVYSYLQALNNENRSL